MTTQTTTMSIRGKGLRVESEAYVAGITADGRDFIGERFFVQITGRDGSRWTHGVRFAGAERSMDDEGFVHFADIRPEAIIRAEALASRIRAAGAVNLLHWDRVDPVYGSEAYQREGIEECRWEADYLEAGR